MLDLYQAQPKAVEKTEVSAEKFALEMATAAEEASSLQKIEMEIAAAAELLKPPGPNPVGTPPAGPNLEELIRAVTKFEKSEESRVVDVFE